MHGTCLKGKTILLTGATGSLGQATAQALLAKGAALILPVRNPHKAETLKNILLDPAPEADVRFLPLDLSDEGSVLSLADLLLKENRPLDAIIHNAGVFTKAGHLSPHGNEWHCQVNALSPMLLTQHLVPLLKLSPSPVVVTVTSLSAFWIRNDPGSEAYAANNRQAGSANAAASSQSPTRLYAQSKRRLLCGMRTLAQQQSGIRFVYAHPGVCATGLFTGTTHQTAYNVTLLKIITPLMKLLFPAPDKASRTTLAALLHAESGQLAEPRGLFHIWGKPHFVVLTERMR